MADQQTLFSLLRFVALVAPAIAIMMQLLESKGERDSISFSLLETALATILIGSLVILSILLGSIEDTGVAIGTTLIFVSLLLVAIAIGWNAASLSAIFAEKLGKSPTPKVVAIQSVKIVISLTLMGSLLAVGWLIAYWATDYLNRGPIRPCLDA